MEVGELEDIVISAIQETQVKLGPSNGSESLYLPLSSLDSEEDRGRIADLMEKLVERCRDSMGDIDYAVMDDRVRIIVPEKGGRYVAKLPVSPVLRLMVDSVREHLTPEELKARLESSFPDCTWKSVDGDGFQYIAYFDEVDPYVYCIGYECRHLIYHRFSRKDYLAFGFDL